MKIEEIIKKRPTVIDQLSDRNRPRLTLRHLHFLGHLRRRWQDERDEQMALVQQMYSTNDNDESSRKPIPRSTVQPKKIFTTATKSIKERDRKVADHANKVQQDMKNDSKKATTKLPDPITSAMPR